MRVNSVGVLVAAFLGLAVFGVAAGLAHHVTSSNEDAVVAVQTRAMEQIVGSTTRSLDDFLRLNVLRLQSLAEREVVTSALVGLEGGDAQEHLERLMTGLKGYWALFAYDKSGRIISGLTASGLDLRGQLVNDRDYYKAIILTREELFISEVFRPQTGEMTGFSLAVPVLDQRGAMIGGIAAVMDREALTREILLPVSLGQSGYAFIWDEKLRTIAHPDPSAVLADLSNEEYAREARLEQRGLLSYRVGPRDKFLAFSTSAVTGWIVCLSAYQDDLVGPLLKERRQALYAGMGAALFLGLLTFFLLKRMVASPLERMTRYAEEMAEGDLWAEPEGAFRLDMQRLAVALERLALEIRRRMAYTHGVLNAMAVPCVVTTREARVSFVNKEFLDLLRKPGEPERYLGMACRELVKDNPKAGALLVEAISEHRPVQEIMELSPVAGEGARGNLVLQARVTPFYDQDNVLQGTVVHWSDQTELHRQRVQVDALHEELRSRLGQAQDLARHLKRYKDDAFQLEDERARLEGEVDGLRRRLDSEVREVEVRLDQRESELTGIVDARDKEIAQLLEERRKAQTWMRRTAAEADGLFNEFAKTVSGFAAKVEDVEQGMREARERGLASRSAADRLLESARAAVEAASKAARDCKQAREHMSRGRWASQDAVVNAEKLQTKAAYLLRSIGELYERSEEMARTQGSLGRLAEMINMLSVNTSIKALRQGSISGDKLAAMSDELRDAANEARNLVNAADQTAQALQTAATNSVRSAGGLVDILERGSRLARAVPGPIREAIKSLEGTDADLESMAHFLEPQPDLTEELRQDLAALTPGDPGDGGPLGEAARLVNLAAKDMGNFVRRLAEVGR